MLAATFRRVFLSAAVAGVLAGLILSAVQAVTTTPLILQAETYEAAVHHGARPAALAAAVASSSPAALHRDRGTGWTPADGWERTAWTTLANMVTGFGFALLLTGCFALSRVPVDAGRAVLWGMAGFAVFTLAPALGLPPELPGTRAAALGARQGWWLFAAAGAALGLWLLVRRASPVARALGALVLVLPHAIGAPHPQAMSHAVPPELAAHFAAASIATAALFWALLGWFSGTAWRRIG